MQTPAVLTSLQEQEIENGYIELPKESYTNSSMTLHVYKVSNIIDIRRWVRQGDIISLKLFSSALEGIFRHLTWETRGTKIDGEYLCHRRFADDTLISPNTPRELLQILHELADESVNQGLKMNKSTTKVMMENNTTIYVKNTKIENVKSYIYMGYIYCTRDKNQDEEIQWRITAG